MEKLSFHFDLRVSDDDNDQVKNSKKAIKDKVVENLNKVGVDESSMMSHDNFAKDVKKDITKYNGIF